LIPHHVFQEGDLTLINKQHKFAGLAEVGLAREQSDGFEPVVPIARHCGRSNPKQRAAEAITAGVDLTVRYHSVDCSEGGHHAFSAVIVERDVPIGRRGIEPGNHEDCERAHEGYRLMLNNEEWGKDCKKMEAPQIIELGDITLVNLDSSSVNDTPDPSASQEKEWVEALNKVSKKLEEQKRKNVWIISHKPFYGMAPFTKTYLPLNLNLRKYLEKSELIKKVQYIFSGHVHTSMIVKGDNFPMQIVLGDGGTKLTDMSAPINENMLKFFNYKSAEIVQGGFGYMMMTKKDKHWTMEFKDAEGRTVKTLDI